MIFICVSEVKFLIFTLMQYHLNERIRRLDTCHIQRITLNYTLFQSAQKSITLAQHHHLLLITPHNLLSGEFRSILNSAIKKAFASSAALAF